MIGAIAQTFFQISSQQINLFLLRSPRRDSGGLVVAARSASPVASCYVRVKAARVYGGAAAAKNPLTVVGNISQGWQVDAMPKDWTVLTDSTRAQAHVRPFAAPFDGQVPPIGLSGEPTARMLRSGSGTFDISHMIIMLSKKTFHCANLSSIAPLSPTGSSRCLATPSCLHASTRRSGHPSAA